MVSSSETKPRQFSSVQGHVAYNGGDFLSALRWDGLEGLGDESRLPQRGTVAEPLVGGWGRSPKSWTRYEM